MEAHNGQDPKGPKRGRSPWKMLALANVIGIDLVVCVFVGFYLGSYIQQLTGHVLWMLAGVLLGIGTGIWSVILIIRRFMEGSDG